MVTVNRFVKRIAYAHPTITGGPAYNVTFTVPTPDTNADVKIGDEAMIVIGHRGSDESAPRGWTRTKSPSSTQVRWRVYQRTIDGTEKTATVTTAGTTSGNPWAVLLVLRCPNPAVLAGASASSETASATSHTGAAAPSPSGTARQLRVFAFETTGAFSTTFSLPSHLENISSGSRMIALDGPVIDPVLAQPSIAVTSSVAVNGHMLALTLRHAEIVEPRILSDAIAGGIGLLP